MRTLLLERGFQLRIDRGVYVSDVKLGDGSPGVVALDSGAGVNVWPKTWSNEAKMEEKIRGLSMVAANGTEIENLGHSRPSSLLRGS